MFRLGKAGTAIACWLILTSLLYVLGSSTLSGILAARAASEQGVDRGFGVQFQDGLRIGQAVGVQVRRKYGLDILLGSAGISALASVLLVLSGVFPWCRPERPPPPLPPGSS